GVVESVGRWRLLGVRSHESAHLGWRIPAAWVAPQRHTHPGAGRRAPEVETESVAAKKAAKQPGGRLPSRLGNSRARRIAKRLGIAPRAQSRAPWAGLAQTPVRVLAVDVAARCSSRY